MIIDSSSFYKFIQVFSHFQCVNFRFGYRWVCTVLDSKADKRANDASSNLIYDRWMWLKLFSRGIKILSEN